MGIRISKLCKAVPAELCFLLLIFLFLKECRNLPKSDQLRLLTLRLLPKALKRRLLPRKYPLCVRKLRRLFLRSLYLIDQPGHALKALRQLSFLIACRIQLIRHRIQCLPFCLCRILFIKKLFPIFLQRRLRISPVLQLLFQRLLQGKRLLQPLIFRKLLLQDRSPSIQFGNSCLPPVGCLLLLLQLQLLIRQKDSALLIRLQRFPVFLRRLRRRNLTVQPRSLRLQRTALRLLLLQLAGICLQHLPKQRKDLFRRLPAG
ncbi:unknown [Firmicutes bacterium CAG:791]|nr:unknown [Firmicutes bacterium CAG:791]